MVTRRRRSFTPQRRKLVWARRNGLLTGVTNLVPQGANLLSELETALGSGLLGTTIARIRGVMGVKQTAGATLSVLRVGMIVVPSATAVTAVTPVTEPYADWMGWRSFADGGSFTGPSFLNNDVIDIKSQRKMEELDQELRLVTDVLGSGTFDVVFDLSMLIRLP